MAERFYYGLMGLASRDDVACVLRNAFEFLHVARHMTTPGEVVIQVNSTVKWCYKSIVANFSTKP